MRELLSNTSQFVGQLYADKSLALRARDLLCFTTDLLTEIYYSTIHAPELIYFLIMGTDCVLHKDTTQALVGLNPQPLSLDSHMLSTRQSCFPNFIRNFK